MGIRGRGLDAPALHPHALGVAWGRGLSPRISTFSASPLSRCFHHPRLKLRVSLGFPFSCCPFSLDSTSTGHQALFLLPPKGLDTAPPSSSPACPSSHPAQQSLRRLLPASSPCLVFPLHPRTSVHQSASQAAHGRGLFPVKNSSLAPLLPRAWQGAKSPCGPALPTFLCPSARPPHRASPPQDCPEHVQDAACVCLGCSVRGACSAPPLVSWKHPSR